MPAPKAPRGMKLGSQGTSNPKHLGGDFAFSSNRGKPALDWEIKLAPSTRKLERAPRRRKEDKFFKPLLALAVVAVLGGIAGVALSLVQAPEEAGELQANPTSSPIPLVTVSPTTEPTTSAPTKFPTQSPTTPTTLRPSRAPTTSSPTTLTGCTVEQQDALCGCNLIQSNLLDILFIVDESGSIATSDFNLQRDAIIEFIDNTSVVGEAGSRFGWMEFRHNVDTGGIIEFTDFLDKQDLINEISTKTKSGGGTNHQLALDEALVMFQNPANAFRNGSQRVVVLMTDGQPNCNCDPVDELKTLALYLEAQNEPFIFYYLPIIPRPGYGSVDPFLFDGDNGLVFNETFIRFSAFGFDELSEKLTTELNIPLGPCITPPPTLL